MLEVGRRLVTDAGGLRPGIDVPFEDVIRQAEVTRSSAYRIWPNKDEFYTDLLLDLAEYFDRNISGFDEMLAEIAIAKISQRVDELRSSQGRHQLLLDICRASGDAYFTHVSNSKVWPNYVLLNSRLVSLEDELYAKVKAASSPHNASFDVAMTSLISQLLLMLGLRLRPGVVSPDFVLQLAGSAVDGVVLREKSVPSQVNVVVRARMFGHSQEASWSLPSIAFTACILSLVEPDPEWHDARIPMISAMLASTTNKA